MLRHAEPKAALGQFAQQVPADPDPPSTDTQAPSAPQAQPATGPDSTTVGALDPPKLAMQRASEGGPSTIPEMWTAWCARCHAPDGSGRVAEPTITVEPMDFTDCSVTSPEGDSDWEAVISHGGPAVGLSSQMPAFGDVLKPSQVSEFVAFIKKFCTERGWPNGNLNLPRPLFAEKAFPENEFIIAPMASHRRGQPTEFELAAVYERRIGRRGS